jgi:hypothetical protein
MNQKELTVYGSVCDPSCHVHAGVPDEVEFEVFVLDDFHGFGGGLVIVPTVIVPN